MRCRRMLTSRLLNVIDTRSITGSRRGKMTGAHRRALGWGPQQMVQSGFYFPPPIVHSHCAHTHKHAPSIHPRMRRHTCASRHADKNFKGLHTATQWGDCGTHRFSLSAFTSNTSSDLSGLPFPFSIKSCVFESDRRSSSRSISRSLSLAISCFFCRSRSRSCSRSFSRSRCRLSSCSSIWLVSTHSFTPEVEACGERRHARHLAFADLSSSLKAQIHLGTLMHLFLTPPYPLPPPLLST